MLTEEHKACIGRTPFSWFMELEGKVKLSRKLLTGLCTRWVERRGGFMIRSDLVSFTTLDVCVLLGLRIGGCVVDLRRKSQDSPIRKLFPSTHVYVKMIFDEIQKRRNDVNVDDFCKLYVLLGLSEFLLPTVSGSVFGGLFSIVDELGELCNYNWGTTVFQFLVQSLYQTSTSL